MDCTSIKLLGLYAYRYQFMKSNCDRDQVFNFIKYCWIAVYNKNEIVECLT